MTQEVSTPIGSREFIIKHAISGRLRLGHLGFKNDSLFARRVVAVLSEFSGFRAARVNRYAGSIVIEYDVIAINAGSILAVLQRTDFSLVDAGHAVDKAAPAADRLFESASRAIERVASPTVQVLAALAAIVGSCLRWRIAPVMTCIASIPIFNRAVGNLVRNTSLNVDGLDALAAVLMICQHNFRTASIMIGLIALGEYIRELTGARCQIIITDLLGLAGRTAWLVRGNKRTCIPAEQVRADDIVVVYPGEMIPVDGIVMRGEGQVDSSNLTGESAAIEIGFESQVFASTILICGQIYLRCTEALAQSRASQVVKLVNTAPIHQTKIQDYAAMWADRAVMPIVGGAAASMLITRDVTRMMSMLIYDFSTGIRVSAPTAVLASMAHAGHRGILVKRGSALETLAKVDAIVFDKTGTLTLGKPAISQIVALGDWQEDQVLSFGAAAENRLSHPAAQAIVQEALARGLKIPPRHQAEHTLGAGVQAQIDDLRVSVGSRRFMEAVGVELSSIEEREQKLLLAGESLSYLAINGKIAGLFAYSDIVRPEAGSVIESLYKRGIKHIVMATGDHKHSADKIAASAGLDKVLSDYFPEHKAELVLSLKDEGYTVAVVGDGINDSPALAHADLAISLNAATDAARQFSDIILTDDDLRQIPEAIDIARGTMRLLRSNLGLVAVPNIAGLVLTAFGLVGPAGATILNNGSAIVAAVNSLRPLIFDDWLLN